MKSRIEKATEVLNKLLRINNDRIAYYQNASENAHELSLKTIFNNVASESEKNASALIREITQSGNNSVGGSKTSRSLFYRFCMKVKAIAAGKDRQSMVDSCIPGEDATQAAYYKAISSDELSMQARQLVRNQQVSLRALYDGLITFRNTPTLILSL